VLLYDILVSLFRTGVLGHALPDVLHSVELGGSSRLIYDNHTGYYMVHVACDQGLIVILI
jgi:hypothetical protein